MRLLLAALAVTSTIAVTASVFAIWPAVGDAPWEDDTAPAIEVIAESSHAFAANDVVHIVQADVAANESWPLDARTVYCHTAEYVSGNGMWVVECDYREDKADDEMVGKLIGTRSYVFDDSTGEVID